MTASLLDTLATAARLTKRQERMQKAVQFLKNYMSTYDKQSLYLDYRDETLIDDVLYALGVALGGKEHQYASGFDVWKAKLMAHISKSPPQDAKQRKGDE